LLKAVAKALHDPRNRQAITHSLRDLIAQRLYGLACGYEEFKREGCYSQDAGDNDGIAILSSEGCCRKEK
jgi:hypothetical protein